MSRRLRLGFDVGAMPVGKLPMMTRVVYFKRAYRLVQRPSICRIFGSRPVYRHVRVVGNGKSGLMRSTEADSTAISCLNWQLAVSKSPHWLLGWVLVIGVNCFWGIITTSLQRAARLIERVAKWRFDSISFAKSAGFVGCLTN
jgi:hypothetical protein